jgi:hypothetical protein
MLNAIQLQLLATALRASTNPDIVAWIDPNVRRDDLVAEWLNSASGQKGWKPSVSRQTLFDAMNLSAYDSIAAGKRETWAFVMDQAPVDATKQNLRDGIVDVFPQTDALTMLEVCLEDATHGQLIFDAVEAVTAGKTGLIRDFTGQFSVDDVSNALNLPV